MAQQFDLQPVANAPSYTADNSKPISSGIAQTQFDLQPVVQQKADPSVNQQEAPGSIGGAIVGGLGNYSASMLESGVDAALWASDKLGITNPKTSAVAKQLASQDITAKLRSGVPGAPNDTFTQGVNKYPITAGVAQYGADAGLLLASVPGKIIQGAGLAAKTADIAARAGVNAAESAGVSGPENENQNLGAKIGAAASLVGDVASPLIGKAVNAASLVSSKIKNFIAPINDQLAKDGSLSIQEQAVKSEAAYTASILKQNTANYQVIKDVPGTINSNVIRNNVMSLYKSGGADIIQQDGKAMLDAKNSVFNDKQINILANIQQQAGKINNMEDALKLRQYISSNKAQFQGKNATDTIYQGYNNLKSAIDSQITQQAEKAGVGDALKSANKFNQSYVQPLDDAGATDRLKAVQANQQRSQIMQNLKPGQPVPPVDPEYTKATRQIFPANPSPQKVKEVLSRMDPSGQGIMERKFIQEAIGDAKANPEMFNKNTSLIKVNQIIDKYGSVLSDDTMETLNGYKKVLQAAGAVAKQEGEKNNTYALHYLGHAIGGGIIGGTVGDEVGGHSNTSRALGAAAGIIGAPLAAKLLTGGMKGLLESQKGQAVLQYINAHPEAAKKLISSMGVGAAAKTTNGQNIGEQ